MKPFQIKYNVIGEIRHGSPYNLAELETTEECKFSIEKNDNWQDKHSWTTNGKYFAQVKWDLENNEPGFRIIIFDSEKGEVMKTDRISGCCAKLKLNNELDINYETFTLISKPAEKKQYGIFKGKIKTGYNNGYS